MFQIFAVAILKMHKYGKSLIVIFISAFLRTNSGPDIMVSEVSVSCATVRTSTAVLDKPSSERAEDSAMREVVCAANQPRHLFTEFGRKVQLTTSSRRENGEAYREDVFGGKWMLSKGKMIQIACSV